MRKKQLLAFLMAGALTVGMTPAAAFAAVDETASLSIEEGMLETEEEEVEVPVETPSAPPEAPVEPEVPSEPTETPSEPTETPSEPDSQPTETPVQPDIQAGGAGELETTATPTPTEAPKSMIMIGSTSYESLAKAIEAVPDNAAETTNITVAGTIELSETVTVSAGKNVTIAAAEENTSIERAAGFTGNMFHTEGTLQFTTATVTKEDGSSVTGTLIVDGSTDDGAATEGTIVEVTGGNFALAAGVTLTGNTTTGNGGAVRNTAGTVSLLGGTITGNQSAEGGALYSEGAVNVAGTVSVTENKKTEGLEENNITLKGENAVITVQGELTNSKVGVDVLEGAEGRKVIALAEGVTTPLADVLAQFTYNGTGFTLDENGALKSTEVAPSPTPTPEIKQLKVTAKSMKWTGHNSIELVANSNKDGQYYVKWVKKGDKAPSFDLDKKGGDVVADYEFKAFVTDLPEEEVDIYICVQDNDKQHKAVLFQPNYQKRPAAPVTPTPDHVPVIPSVKDSVVTGLENPLEFYPNKFYDFTVVGAGTQNKNPGTGDVKWVPLYWSMSSNPSDRDKHTSWRIGTTNGLKTAATYNLYVFFQKAVYDGSSWQMTDTVESVAYKFMSKAISITATPTPGGNEYGGGGDGSGDGYSDPEDYTDSADDSKDAVATGDETPVGTMMALAAASLLAGGYVLVRRRKKEI